MKKIIGSMLLLSCSVLFIINIKNQINRYIANSYYYDKLLNFVVKNGIAKITAVSISNRNESSAWINKGLNNGDTIMISNILRSADGTPVRIVSITDSKK